MVMRSLRREPLMERGTRVRREDVERRRLDALLDRPRDGAIEDVASSPSMPNTKLPLIITPRS
jgi:hypothetical protein